MEIPEETPKDEPQMEAVVVEREKEPVKEKKKKNLKKAKDQINKKLEKSSKKSTKTETTTKTETKGPSVSTGSHALNFTNQSGTQINFWGASPRTVFGDKVKDVKGLEEAALRFGGVGPLPAIDSQHDRSRSHSALSTDAEQLFEVFLSMLFFNNYYFIIIIKFT